MEISEIKKLEELSISDLVNISLYLKSWSEIDEINENRQFLLNCVNDELEYRLNIIDLTGYKFTNNKQK